MAIKKLLDVVLTSLDNGKATDVDIFDNHTHFGK